MADTISNVWRLSPIYGVLSSPSYRWDGDSVPSVSGAGGINLTLGQPGDIVNETLTKVTDTFYIYSFGTAEGVPVAFALVRIPNEEWTS